MLSNEIQNKMQKVDKTKEVEDILIEQDYFFPEQGVTIKASSLIEAQRKLEQQKNLNKNNTIKKQ